MALSPLAQVDDVRTTESSPHIFDSSQRARRDIPSLTLLGDNRNRLLVVSREHAQKRLPSFGLERDPITDRKLQHSRMGSGLMQETQPFDDPIVQVDQLCFSKAINLDLGCLRSLSPIGLTPACTIPHPLRPNVQGERRAAQAFAK